MIKSITTIITLGAASCLLLAGCGPAKSTATGASATHTAATGTAPPATTAAGDGGSGSGGGGATTACELITESDASTAIGSAAGSGKAGGTAALSECIYDDGSLIVSMKTDAKAFYDKSHTDAHAKGASDVPDLGDSAFEAGTSGFCTLMFIKGTTIVSVLVGGNDAEKTAIAVAKIAAAKM